MVYLLKYSSIKLVLLHSARNREEDTGSGYVPRWRRYNRDDNDIASSSNTSSMTDLHVTRKDSSASSDSVDAGHCKLTYENLKLHDKLSSSSPPYSSLSRLEEGPTIAPVPLESIGIEPQTSSERKHSTSNRFVYKLSWWISRCCNHFYFHPSCESVVSCLGHNLSR